MADKKKKVKAAVEFLSQQSKPISYTARADMLTEEADDKSMEKEPDETPIPMVLEPDHPMMERFQIALKNHLLRQIDRLSNQVSELDNEIKKKEKEKEETGLELYDLQQEIFKQQKTLEDCDNTIDSLMQERQTLDESVKTKKSNWKEEINRLNCAKKKENDMFSEYRKLSTLEKQMEKWQQDMESELTVSQRISEKTQFDKNKLIEEKRKMDMYLLRIMTAVSDFESEIGILGAEIDAEMEKKDSLNQTLADAAADLQALVAEQKRLMTAWNSVVSTINHRNLIYSNVNKELNEAQEAFRSLNAEIESYKRTSAEEMKKSEKLAIILGRIENERDTLEFNLKSLYNKKLVLEQNITSTAAIIDRTQAQLQSQQVENEKITVKVTALRNVMEKLYHEKRKYEDEAISSLQDQIFNDKSAVHLNKLLKEAREKTRKQEFSLLETENKISQKFFEAEKLKEVIFQNSGILKEMEAELNLREEELKKCESEISKSQTAIIQKQGNYAILLRKLEKCMEKTGYGKAGASPLQLRIVELEKLNQETQAKNDKMQGLWLLLQTNNVKLTQQRNEQLKDISILRRQVLLLEQTALRTERDYMLERKFESDLNKSISKLQNKLGSLAEVLVDKKDYRVNLGKENSLVQAQYTQNLKDSEMEQIRLKAEIKDLEGNLEDLAENMLGTQREMLAWEKKIQSAVETRTDVQKEKSDQGEAGQMKAEIHRMEVRYSHLKKAQEKLIGDLELSVYRRDAIVDGADGMERRKAKGYNARIIFQKKINELKTKIRAVRNEQKQLEQKIQETQEGHEELKKAILEKENLIEQMENTSKKIDLKLEDGKLQKIQNLEMLIRKQKKCKMYDLLKSKKHRLLYKTEGSLENEYQKVKNTNGTLISIAEALIEDFPAYRFELKKIYNTLQAQPA